MLTPEQFWDLYGLGASVYDARGRRLHKVLSCNLETGEVIRWAPISTPFQRLFLMVRRISRWHWTYSLELSRRHGFWPAPLVVTPMAVPSGFQSVKQRIEQAQGTTARGLTLADLDDLIDAVEVQS